MKAERDKFKVALCQCSSVLADKDLDPRPPNLKKALENIRKAAREGAKLAIFGEIYLQGYGSQEYFSKYATTLNPPDDYFTTLAQSAEENDIYVIMGMVTRAEQFPEDLFNSAVFVGPDGLIGTYRKTHVAAWAGVGPAGAEIIVAEKSCYSPGNEIPVFDTPLGRIGIQVCYDIWFPEVTRVQTLKGAQLIVNTSAAVSPFEESWDILLRARAMENQIWLALTSVVGKQRDYNLFGGSRVVDPTGRESGRAKDNVEDFVIAEVDYKKERDMREQSHYFHDRNPRLYDEIAKTT